MLNIECEEKFAVPSFPFRNFVSISCFIILLRAWLFPDLKLLLRLVIHLENCYAYAVVEGHLTYAPRPSNILVCEKKKKKKNARENSSHIYPRYLLAL